MNRLCCTSADIFKFLTHLENLFTTVENNIMNRLHQIIVKSKCSIQHEENT